MSDPEIRRDGQSDGPVRWAAVAGAALAVTAVLAVIAISNHQRPDPRDSFAGALSGPSGQVSPGSGRAEVAIAAHAPVTVIPRSFLGFSTEYWTLPVDERHIELYKRVLDLLHVPGNGPFILRIGGDSSDHAFWDPTR